MQHATNATRLTDELLKRGYPVLSVSGTTATTVRVQYAPGTLQATIDAANAYVQNTFDWSAAAHTAWLNAQQRTAAGVQYDATDATGKRERAFAMLVLDEFNAVRQWLVSFKVAVAASISLADLKARVALLPDMPDRTAGQLRAALANKLNNLD